MYACARLCVRVLEQGVEAAGSAAAPAPAPAAAAAAAAPAAAATGESAVSWSRPSLPVCTKSCVLCARTMSVCCAGLSHFVFVRYLYLYLYLRQICLCVHVCMYTCARREPEVEAAVCSFKSVICAVWACTRARVCVCVCVCVCVRVCVCFNSFEVVGRS